MSEAPFICPKCKTRLRYLHMSAHADSKQVADCAEGAEAMSACPVCGQNAGDHCQALVRCAERVAELEARLSAYEKAAATPEIAAHHAQALRDATLAHDELEAELDEERQGISYLWAMFAPFLTTPSLRDHTPLAAAAWHVFDCVRAQAFEECAQVAALIPPWCNCDDGGQGGCVHDHAVDHVVDFLRAKAKEGTVSGELEAQCAAMRDALDQWGHDRDCARYPRHDQPCDCNIEEALATDAGKAILDELAEWRRLTGKPDPDAFASYLSRLTVPEVDAETGRVMAALQVERDGWRAAMSVHAERAEKAEEYAETLQEANDGLGESWDKAMAQVRAQAFEECAKVAEAQPDFSKFHRGLSARSDIATAIRTKAKEEGT